MAEKVVTFQLGSEHYGIPMENVISIERIGNITNVPQTPDYIRGIFELRGEVIPVIDLRTYLLGTTAIDVQKNRIIIVVINSQIFGIIVDQAHDIIDVSSEMIEHVPIQGLKIDDPVKVAKLNERLIMIIDIERLLSNNDVVHALEAVRQAM